MDITVTWEQAQAINVVLIEAVNGNHNRTHKRSDVNAESCMVGQCGRINAVRDRIVSKMYPITPITTTPSPFQELSSMPATPVFELNCPHLPVGEPWVHHVRFSSEYLAVSMCPTCLTEWIQ